MLRLASDADVHGDVLRGLRRRLPAIDLNEFKTPCLKAPPIQKFLLGPPVKIVFW